MPSEYDETENTFLDLVSCFDYSNTTFRIKSQCIFKSYYWFLVYNYTIINMKYTGEKKYLQKLKSKLTRVKHIVFLFDIIIT